MKTSVIGHWQREAKEGGVLNGVLRGCEHGWAYEENQRHSYWSRRSSWRTRTWSAHREKIRRMNGSRRSLICRKVTKSLQTGRLQHVQTTWRRTGRTYSLRSKNCACGWQCQQWEHGKFEAIGAICERKTSGSPEVRLPRKNEQLGWAGCRRTADPLVVECWWLRITC